MPSLATDPQFADKLSASQVEYPRDLKRYYDHDSTKRGLLMAALSEQYLNLIKNLRNKPDRTYEELMPVHRDHLSNQRSGTYSGNVGNTALATTQQEEQR